MSGQPNNSRRKGYRALTWAGLVLVPALAIVALGSGLLPTLLGSPSAAPVPSGLLLSETRQLNFQGNDLASSPAVKLGQHESIDQFMDTWQNTVRVPPSPRL